MVLFLVAVAGVLLNTSAVDAEVLRIGGTGSGLGTVRILASAFEKKHPHLEVQVLPSIGSSGAINAIAQGALDIGLVSRPLKREELLFGLMVTNIYKTPFVLATERRTPAANLSHEDLARIYKGETKLWPNGERIRIVLRPAADADNVIARGISSKMSDAIDKALLREGMVVASTDQECIELIEMTPGAIGFSTLAQIMAEGRTAKILSYNGVFPSRRSLMNGTYPLSLELAFVTKPDRSFAVRSFIDFVHSPKGMEILETLGSIPFKDKQ